MDINDEKRQLFEDYRNGKITPEQFMAMRAALGNDTPKQTPKNYVNPVFLIGGGVIIVLLAVIAYLLFSNSPATTRSSTPDINQFTKAIVDVTTELKNETSAIENSTRATEYIISAREIKAGFLMYHVDHPNFVKQSTGPDIKRFQFANLLQYINTDNVISPEKVRFDYVFPPGGKTIYICTVYDLSKEPEGVKRALELKSLPNLLDSDGKPYKKDKNEMYFVIYGE